MASGFMSHLAGREAAQFIVNEGKQLIGGGGIAGLGAFEDAGYIAHAIQSKVSGEQREDRRPQLGCQQDFGAKAGLRVEEV
jgi:hypothetical protein